MAALADKTVEAARRYPVEGTHPNTVLVVDDEQSIREYLAEVLRFEGYDCHCFSGSLAALSYLSAQEGPADLVLADISMPDMGGIALLRSVKETHPELPVILVSGLYELALAIDALEAGADDYLKKPVKPTDLVTLVAKYLDSGTAEQEEQVQHALRDFLATSNTDPTSSRLLEQLFQKLGFKRYETFQHSARVAAASRLVGEHCGIADRELQHLELGALLHDIGKIAIPRNVLMKPGKLTDEEWRVMKEHPAIGYRVLMGFPELREESKVVYSHHESYDGRGYPQGLAGDEIPLGARIFAIVDTFDAMTSDRPYRAAQSVDAARAEIEWVSGKQFDPELVDVFLRIPAQELQGLRDKYPDRAA